MCDLNSEMFSVVFSIVALFSLQLFRILFQSYKGENQLHGVLNIKFTPREMITLEHCNVEKRERELARVRQRQIDAAAQCLL